ncbi:MAG: glycosyltransferase family 2 protein [Verrucomicrobia bacterium]|nr:glycosyltransferase family 2 protein [Verrucomicrobiota bacterium]
MRLSVVIPNYNHGKHLPSCLDAILRQSSMPEEVIVLDDCSTDNSVEVIGQFVAHHPVVRLVRNERNCGAIPNVNKGLDLAQGKYVFFCAADDQVLPGFFEKSLRLLEQHPQAAFSATIGDWHEEVTGFNWQMGVGLGTEARYFAPAELVELGRKDRLYIVTHTAIFRRECLIEVGKFIPELCWHADWFACYTSAMRYGFCFVPEPLGRFNILPNSFMKKGRDGKSKHEQVIHGIMERLILPEYAAEAERIRLSGTLYEFALPMLRVLRRDVRFKRFLTPALVRRCLWHQLKVSGKNYLPVWLANIYFRLAGYRAQPAAGC